MPKLRTLGRARREARRRREMFAADPFCWYCGRHMRWYAELRVCGEQLHAGSWPLDMATVEHLHSRTRGRVQVKNQRRVRVLACYDCNRSRGRWSQLLMRAGL